MSTSWGGPFRYSIYGECLESEIPFPELRECPGGDPRWWFALDYDLPDRPDGEVLGGGVLYDDVRVRLLEDTEGARWILVDDSGVFRISRDGRTIHWRPNREPSWEFGRADLMGRVLNTTLHMEGLLTLHAGAVDVGPGAVAFLAPSGSGKSTLSLSLVQRGGRLVTDDDLPVELPDIGSVRVRPGGASARLTDESRQRLGIGRDRALNREGKLVVSDLPERAICGKPVPLEALYLLASVPPRDAEATVRRVRMGAVEATLAVQGQVKFGEMLGAAAMPTLLDRVATLVRRVPVYTLYLVRDFDRLDEGLDQLLSWHPTG